MATGNHSNGGTTTNWYKMITVHDRELCKRALGYDIKETVSLNRESSPKSAKISTPLCINQSQSQLLRAQEWLSRKARRNVIVIY